MTIEQAQQVSDLLKQKKDLERHIKDVELARQYEPILQLNGIDLLTGIPYSNMQVSFIETYQESLKANVKSIVEAIELIK